MSQLRENHEEGFTLIELLVVILIIGILAAVAVPMFLNNRKAAGLSNLKSDLTNVSKQMYSKKVIVNAVPSDFKPSDGVYLSTKPVVGNISTNGDLLSGTGAGWSTYNHTGTPLTVTSTNDGSGPGGRNYRSYLRSSEGTSNVGVWHTVPLGADTRVGDKFTVAYYVRENADRCRNFGVEEKAGANGSILASVRTDFCYTANQWTYATQDYTITNPTTNHLILTAYYPGTSEGDAFDITGATVFKKQGNNAYNAGDGQFCVQGTHASDPTVVWKFDSANGGLKEGTC